jgi:hypothetical protein
MEIQTISISSRVTPHIYLAFRLEMLDERTRSRASPRTKAAGKPRSKNAHGAQQKACAQAEEPPKCRLFHSQLTGELRRPALLIDDG